MANRSASGWRKWVFRMLAVALGLIGLELSSWVILVATGKEVSGLRAERRAILEASANCAEPARPREVIHPYLGFVVNPEAQTEGMRAFHGVSVSRYGFLDDNGPIQTRARDRFVVGIFGGSFASWVYLDARDTLSHRLEATGLLADRRVVVVDAALGGYKQPQQLMALGYLLSLGGEFDAVVNVDGFNEVVLPVLENLPKRVSLFYPRNWFLRTGTLSRPLAARTFGMVALLEERRGLVASCFSATALDRSATGNAVWAALDRYLVRRLGRAEGGFLRADGRDEAYVTSGPYQDYPDRASMFLALADMWKVSSIQMSRLAAANGALYLHFLQPNQYLEGTKPMGEAEVEVAIDANEPYGPVAQEGYPFLVAAAKELPAAGVDYHDLTTAFSEVGDPLYRDGCCHVNTAGSAIIAELVADAIVARLASTRSGPAPGVTR